MDFFKGWRLTSVKRRSSVVDKSQENLHSPVGRHGACKILKGESNMSEPVDKPIRDFYASFRRDVAAFEKHLSRMLREYPGEYVAILDGEIVDHKQTWEELAESTHQRFPDKFVFLEKVIPKTKTVVDMDTLEG